MLDSRSSVSEGASDQLGRNQPVFKHCRRLICLVVLGIVGAGAALAAGKNVLRPEAANEMCWNSLKGSMPGAPKLILAIDESLNLQGFFVPPGGPASAPTSGVPQTAVVIVEKYGSHSHYCYTMDGKKECIEH